MKVLGVLALSAAASLAATTASAQVLNLSGQFLCVQGCAGPAPAFVAQSGWDMNLVNEAGVPSRAWIDHPGHIWARNWNEGAVYSPDGMTIQFDGGTVWRRVVVLGEGVAAVAPPLVGQVTPAMTPPLVAQVTPAEAPPLVAPVTPAVAPAATPAVATAANNPRPTPARWTPGERAAARVSAYDGDWSVVILTRTGNCGPSYRYGVRISNGAVVNDYGQSVSVQGRVSPNGLVRVALAAGGQSASGSGRLSSNYGGGTWRGQGSDGYCAGVWRAARR
jgi:hypothetical protein